MTAEEFLSQKCYRNMTGMWNNVSEQDLIEFAKYHVEQALKASHRNMQLPLEDLEFTLDSYPLTNIK